MICVRPYAHRPRVAFLIALACSPMGSRVADAAQGPSTDWPIPRRFRVSVEVQLSLALRGTRLPSSVEIPFGKLLRDAGVDDEFDYRSIVVTLIDATTRKQIAIDHLADEDFQHGDTGQVSWAIASPEQRQYFVYFDTRSRGPYQRGYIPPVGHGDDLRYNRRGGADPLWAHGISPWSPSSRERSTATRGGSRCTRSGAVDHLLP